MTASYSLQFVSILAHTKAVAYISRFVFSRYNTPDYTRYAVITIFHLNTVVWKHFWWVSKLTHYVVNYRVLLARVMKATLDWCVYGDS